MRIKITSRRPLLIPILLVILPAAQLWSEAAGPGAKSEGLATLILTIERDLPGLHARLTRAEARELAARALPRWYAPDLRAELGGGVAANGSETRSGPLARIVAEWKIWDGGRAQERGTIGQARARIAAEEVNLFRYDLRLSLARGFFRLAEIAELRRINADETRRIAQLKNLLYPRIRIGAIGVSEVTGLDLRHAELDDANTALGGEGDRILNSLRILSGSQQEPVALKAIESIFAHALPGKSGAFDPEQTPHLRLARLRARLGRSAAELARRELYWPSLGLEVFGGYQPFRDAIDPARPEIGAGLTIRLPLFGTGDRSAALDSARKESAAGEMIIEQTLRENSAHIAELTQILNESLARAGEIDRLGTRARANLALAYNEFAGGLKAPADMREAIRLVFEFERQKANLHLRAHLARFELDLPAALADRIKYEKKNSGENK